MNRDCGCQEKHSSCVECGTPPLERLNYFDGKFLTGRDFSDEQGYLIGKHREHDRRLHGWGTVCGLKVTQHPDEACRDRFVVIEPGLALDCCGREIHVTEKVYVDLREQLAGVDAAAAAPNVKLAAKTLLISLCYDECRTEYEPVLYSDCACDDGKCLPSRVRESFCVRAELAPSKPKPKPRDPSGVLLARSGMLRFDSATRIAVDPVRNRAFLLNDSGKLAIFDTPSGTLLQTFDLGASAADIALSPNGDTLYAVLPKKLRALDVRDLNTIAKSDETPIGKTPSRVLASATRIFVLDGTTVGVYDTTAKLPLFAEFKQADLRSIAISADGQQLYAAVPAKVLVVDVPSLAGVPKIETIPVADDPTHVAVPHNGTRLFVGTAAKSVRLYSTGAGHAQSGDGVSLPVAIADMAASPDGVNLYVLGDDAGKAVISVVSAERIAKNPPNAVSDPIPAGDKPEQIAVAGENVFVMLGGAAVFSAGAAVFEIEPRDCSEIVWKALDGCPDCEDESCVLLAAVDGFVLGQSVTDARIDNKVRPLVPSTTTLRELIECCCGGGGEGPQGPPGDKGQVGDKGAAGDKGLVGDKGLAGDKGGTGDKGTTGDKGATGDKGKTGDKGPQGEPGKPGDCCEEGLTRIDALSWRHDETVKMPLAIVRIPGAKEQFAFIMRFDHNVFIPDITTGQRIFRVELENHSEQPFRCYCELIGPVIGVENIKLSGGIIVTADRSLASVAPGLAFLLGTDAQTVQGLLSKHREIRVTLFGDHLKDENKRAVDAEFCRSQLPTGDHPDGKPFGIQGGTFYSWFWFEERPKTQL